MTTETRAVLREPPETRLDSIDLSPSRIVRESYNASTHPPSGATVTRSTAAI
ncbi:MAG: hypothetical protein HYZ58_11000 [Acidobacteria bacterium]|nr:hypothetical protein [Acidobacteriota bacterium]